MDLFAFASWGLVIQSRPVFGEYTQRLQQRILCSTLNKSADCRNGLAMGLAFIIIHTNYELAIIRIIGRVQRDYGRLLLLPFVLGHCG